MQTFEKIEKSNVILEERNRLLEEALLYSSNADCYLNVSKMLHHRSHEDVSIGEVISDAPFIVFVPSIACEACSENSLMNLSKLIGILGDRLKVICHPDEYKDVLEYCGFNTANIYTIDTNLTDDGSCLPKGLDDSMPYLLRVSPSGYIRYVFSQTNEMIPVINEYVSILSSMERSIEK